MLLARRGEEWWELPSLLLLLSPLSLLLLPSKPQPVVVVVLLLLPLFPLLQLLLLLPLAPLPSLYLGLSPSSAARAHAGPFPLGLRVTLKGVCLVEA